MRKPLLHYTFCITSSNIKTSHHSWIICHDYATNTSSLNPPRRKRKNSSLLSIISHSTLLQRILSNVIFLCGSSSNSSIVYPQLIICCHSNQFIRWSLWIQPNEISYPNRYTSVQCIMFDLCKIRQFRLWEKTLLKLTFLAFHIGTRSEDLSTLFKS